MAEEESSHHDKYDTDAPYYDVPVNVGVFREIIFILSPCSYPIVSKYSNGYWYHDQRAAKKEIKISPVWEVSDKISQSDNSGDFLLWFDHFILFLFDFKNRLLLFFLILMLFFILFLFFIDKFSKFLILHQFVISTL